MSNDVRDLLIAWSLLPFLTPNRTRLLLETFEPADAACSASVRVLEGLLTIDREQAELVKNPLRTLRPRVAALREHAITLIDDQYPPLLKEIIDPPLALYLSGDRALLKLPAVAVVGSRRASPYAVNAAQHLARHLVESDLVVVSGLATGVDSAAHRSALAAKGKTIAVLGTGIDVIYPRSNARLFREIESAGLVVTGFAPGTPPLPVNFPIRNRVISGLSLGTVIVEATRRSGSLITARLAAEQGREVFAVPGSIFAPGSEGTHRLIQYGAKLVHDIDDVLDELPQHAYKRKKTEIVLPESPLLEVLQVFDGDDGMHIEAAAMKLGETVASLSEPVLQLEIGGWLRALPGSRYVRVR